MQDKVSGIVIAGGKSSRMGTNKALLMYKGQRLIDRAIQVLEPITGEIMISSNDEISHVLYPLVCDEVKDIGPIGGLYTTLKKSETLYNMVIPCDVPNLTTEFYQNMLEEANDSDALIPILQNGKVEPLVAIYSKTILTKIEKQISKRDYKLVNLLEHIKVKYLEVFDEQLFVNINKPADLKLPVWPNLLLVAGTDRNVGKTTFACRVIEKVSKSNEVYAIKITPHFHALPEQLPIIAEEYNLKIIQEIWTGTGKDSSRMLAAGAKKVFYVQTLDENLDRVIQIIKPLLEENRAVVCESAALSSFVSPGLFVLLSQGNKHAKNQDKIPFAHLHVKNFNYDLNAIEFIEGRWNLKNVW